MQGSVKNLNRGGEVNTMEKALREISNLQRENNSFLQPGTQQCTSKYIILSGFFFTELT